MFSALFLAYGLSAALACCPPEQWETKAFDFNSLDSWPYEMTIAHDDHTRMEGVYINVIAFDRTFKHYIKDYNSMIQYEVDLFNIPNTCKQSRLEETFISHAACSNHSIPGLANPEFHGSVTVGLPPSTIQMKSVSYEMDGKKTWLGVGENGCFPIYEKVKPLPGFNRPDMMLLYYNATASVVSGDIFNIPASCISVT